MPINTVFVIGAGASKEANLPLGLELKDKIAQILDIDIFRQHISDPIIYNTFEILARKKYATPYNIQPYLNAANHIRDSLPLAISIDNFIDTQRENENIAICGKLAIIRSILEAERNSLLFFKKEHMYSSIDFKRLQDTWYTSFFQLITENCCKADLKERFKNITFIIFNYDRCIEHFLFHALKNYYEVQDQEAADLVKIIKIYHPYGFVGHLPYFTSNKEEIVHFGLKPHPEQLVDLSAKIKTFTEGTATETSSISDIKTCMSQADRIVFLGFAFHKLNMELIKPTPVISDKRKECFTTAKGISASDMKVVINLINAMFPGGLISIGIKDITCSGLFKEYWRSLSFTLNE